VEDEIAGRLESEDQMNRPRPARLGQIAHSAHHRRDANTTSDQNDALSVLAGEVEGAVRRFDLDLVARPCSSCSQRDTRP